MAFDNYVSMELDDDDQINQMIAAPAADKPKFPYGLRICLCKGQLDALGLNDDVEVGHVLHFKAFARVTSVSENQMESGARDMRVELQIESMSVPEDEDEE